MIFQEHKNNELYKWSLGKQPNVEKIIKNHLILCGSEKKKEHKKNKINDSLASALLQ